MVEDGVGVVDGAQVGVADGALVGDLDGDGVGDGADPPSSWDQDFTEADVLSGTDAGGEARRNVCLT